MNLLFIRSTTGFSGAERYHEYLFHGLRKHKNIRIGLITNHRKFYTTIRPLTHASRRIYLPIREVGTKKTLLTALLWLPYLLLLYALTIRDMEKKKKFDVIILESTTEKLCLTPILNMFGYKVSWLEHAPMFDTNRSEIVKKLYRWASRYGDHILCWSEDTKRDLTTHGIGREKVTAFYIGIPPQKYRQESHGNMRRKLKIPAPSPVVSFIGGVTSEKGIVEFIKTCEHLSKTFPNLHAIILGDGPKMQWLSHEIEKKKFTNIHVVGFVDNVWEYLSLVTIAFFPTKHKEGLSLAILESLIAERLVVARDIGGNRELIIDGKTGFLFKNDTESMSTLRDILSGKKRIPRLRQNISRLLSEKFSLDKQTKKFIHVLA